MMYILLSFLIFFSLGLSFYIYKSIRANLNKYKKIFLVLFLILILCEICLIATYDLVFGIDISFLKLPLTILFVVLYIILILLAIIYSSGILNRIFTAIKLLIIGIIVRFGIYSIIEYFGMIPLSIPIICGNSERLFFKQNSQPIFK